MSTDQQFFEKEYSHLSRFEKIMVWAIPIGSIAIAIIATLFLFVLKPDEPCDPIDKVGAWCRVHPLYWYDIVGAIMFYWGTFWLGSVLPRFFIAIGLLEDDSVWFPLLNIFAFLCAIFGFIIMYFA